MNPAYYSTPWSNTFWLFCMIIVRLFANICRSVSRQWSSDIVGGGRHIVADWGQKGSDSAKWGVPFPWTLR